MAFLLSDPKPSWADMLNTLARYGFYSRVLQPAPAGRGCHAPGQRVNRVIEPFVACFINIQLSTKGTPSFTFWLFDTRGCGSAGCMARHRWSDSIKYWYILGRIHSAHHRARPMSGKLLQRMMLLLHVVNTNQHQRITTAYDQKSGFQINPANLPQERWKNRGERIPFS